MTPATLPFTEAAAYLGIPERTAYRLLANGEFPVPVLKVGRRRLVSRQLLEQFVNGEQVAS
jgi:excisionase family DNA binding protein